jgi:hypothetical protein
LVPAASTWACSWVRAAASALAARVPEGIVKRDQASSGAANIATSNSLLPVPSTPPSARDSIRSASES